jgi:hypothetical protein
VVSILNFGISKKIISSLIFQCFKKTGQPTFKPGAQPTEGKGSRLHNVNKYNNTQLTEASGTTRLWMLTYK